MKDGFHVQPLLNAIPLSITDEDQAQHQPQSYNLLRQGRGVPREVQHRELGLTSQAGPELEALQDAHIKMLYPRFAECQTYDVAGILPRSSGGPVPMASCSFDRELNAIAITDAAVWMSSPRLASVRVTMLLASSSFSRISFVLLSGCHVRRYDFSRRP